MTSPPPTASRRSFAWAIIFLLSSAPLTAQETPRDKDGPLVILMAPTGSDANDGATPDSPIKTLSRAQEILRDTLATEHRDVEIRIAPGTYHKQTVVWTFTMPDHEIKFMPSSGDKPRPVFDGVNNRGTWFRLDHTQGQRTNLHFRYIQVQNYATAISLNGNRDHDSTCNKANRVYGCMFRDVGEGSTAALRLVNSRDNEIVNNHFVNILRKSSCVHLHAIYAAHMSSGNKILRNRFTNGCGDPVRIRDYSNNNIVSNNLFERTGIAAAFTDWYCDHDARDDCTKPAPECPSWDNQFRNNTLRKNYAGKPLRAWQVFQDDTTTGCGKPTPTSQRLLSSGNVTGK